ncbi:MAG: metallophosphoesterase [Cyclobacteriaceae bacterium]|nr:metallophosphoesterase [Cyclobacteriaceae bacterium HetDA_MAG_MS6]
MTRLWHRLNPRPSDQVFLLGDYISKGPTSVGVLDYLIDLKSSKYQIFFVRGNHDQLLLDFLEQPHDESKKQVLLQNGLLPKELQAFLSDSRYRDFLLSTHHFIRTEGFLLVHAGFDFEKENAFSTTEDMLTIRKFSYNREKAGNRTVVHGHVPLSLSVIHKNIEEGKPIIPLDNGCVYPERSGQGNLLALDLDTMNLVNTPYEG